MKTPHSVCSNPLLESLLLKEQPYLSGMSPPSRHTACLCPTHPFKLMAILLRRTASQCCPYTCLGSPQPPSAPFGEKAINKGWKALVSVYCELDPVLRTLHALIITKNLPGRKALPGPPFYRGANWRPEASFPEL